MNVQATGRLVPGGLPGRRGHLSVEKPQHAGQAIRRLWRYLRRYRALLILVFLLVLINISANLACSYLLRPLINRYIIPGNLPGLIKMILLMLAVYLAGSAAAIMQARLMVKLAQKTVGSIRADLFDHLEKLPLPFFDRQSHGDLMSRFSNDVDNISDSLNSSLTQLFSSSLTLLGTLSLMLLISPLLTGVTLLLVSLMLLVTVRIIRASKQYFTEQQNALGAANGYMEEMISGLKVVKVFCHEAEAVQDFEQLNETLRQRSASAQLYSGIMMPVIQNLNTINFALTAAIGGLLAVLRGLDVGGLAAFLQYSRQFARPVNEISSQFNSLQAALAGAERIFNVIDQPPEPADDPQAIDPGEVKADVVFDQVNFEYNPGQPVLKNISFHAKPGQKLALVGSTGAGKTTIMNLLPKFYDIRSGRILIDGTDTRMIRRDRLRRMMAIVLQDTHLFSGTVMDNIRYGRLDAGDEEVIAAAKLANAHSFIRRLPQGYHTLLEGDGKNLSQGQRQLLNIARAAVAKPAILILDEATSSIDTRTEIAIQAGMDELMKGRTSFVIAHRLSTVRNADEILVLENGEIVERGTHDELLQQRGRYQQLYKGQFD
jgi:ATP-binding cassette subfamily B protein